MVCLAPVHVPTALSRENTLTTFPSTTPHRSPNAMDAIASAERIREKGGKSGGGKVKRGRGEKCGERGGQRGRR